MDGACVRDSREPLTLKDIYSILPELKSIYGEYGTGDAISMTNLVTEFNRKMPVGLKIKKCSDGYW